MFDKLFDDVRHVTVRDLLFGKCLLWQIFYLGPPIQTAAKTAVRIQE